MAILTREAILAANDTLRENVDVPEWGGTVIVRGLTGAERDAFETETIDMSNAKNVRYSFANTRARLVARACVDESGRRLFSDSDMAALGNKSAAALDRVFSVAQRLSGLTKEDIDELTKNSDGGQSGDSISA